MKAPPIPIPTNLPAPVAMALLNLLNDLHDAIWLHYESALVPIIIAEYNQDPASQSELSDFDDGISF